MKLASPVTDGQPAGSPADEKGSVRDHHRPGEDSRSDRAVEREILRLLERRAAMDYPPVDFIVAEAVALGIDVLARCRIRPVTDTGDITEEVTGQPTIPALNA